METKLNNLAEKFKNFIDRQEFADLLNKSISTMKSEQQILRQYMLSFTTYLAGKAETLLNNSDMNRFNIKEAIDGQATEELRETFKYFRKSYKTIYPQ